MSQQIENTSDNPKPEWLRGRNPEAIEQQEKLGQEQLVAKSYEIISQLPAPTGIDDNAIEIYQSLGINVIGPSQGDPIFLDVNLPEGWLIKPTDNLFYSELYDEKNRKRALIYYKAAFYERLSSIIFYKRFGTQVLIERPTPELADWYEDYSQTFITGKVYDLDHIIFETNRLAFGPYAPTDRNDQKREVWFNAFDQFQKSIYNQCTDFLEKNYPDYKNVLAYWD